MIENQNSGDQQSGPDRAPQSTSFSEKPPPESNKRTSNRNYDACREWARLVLEIAALFYLVRYVHWTKIQSIATENTANAAKDSADTTRRQFELSERPWVSVHASPLDPLDFHCSGWTDDVCTQIELHLKNSGHSVATGVWAVAKFFDIDGLQNHDAVAAQKQMCDSIAQSKEIKRLAGETLFPDDTLDVPKLLRMTHEELVTANARRGVQPASKTLLFEPLVIGCVDYRASPDIGPDYQTRFIFQLATLGTTPGVFRAFEQAVGNYPAKDLTIVRYPFGGNAAY